MFQASVLDDIARELARLLPPGTGELQRDFEKNMRQVIARGLQRMELVTREEFDVQSAVLARTREKLEALEQRVALLEAQHSEAH